MKKLIIIVGLALFVLGGVTIWRTLNPPKTEREIIAEHVEDIARTASAKRLSAVLSYLDKGFKYGSMSKKDVQSGLAAGFWQYQKINVKVSGVVVDVSGNEATSSGHYNVGTQASEGAGVETYAGDFKIKWRKNEDGDWKAVEGEAGKLPGF